MARKKKLTERQKKARKHAYYVRSEYYKNIDAIDYLRDYVKIAPIKLSNKPTMRQLHIVQEIYKKAKAEIDKLGDYFVNLTTGEITESLPTKKQMVQEVRSERTQEYRQNRAEPEEAPSTFDPDMQYIQDLKDRINQTRALAETLTNRRDASKTEANYEKHALQPFLEAKQRLLSKIDYAIAKLGVVEAASILADDYFMQRIANLDEKYAYEIVGEIDGDNGGDGLLGLLDSSISTALNSY